MSEKFVGYIKRQGTSKFYPLFTNNGEQSIWLGFEYDADEVSEAPFLVGEFYLDENGVPTIELEDTDTTVNGLKPCPFCGSEAEECFDDEGNVQCSNCDCQMGMATVCPSVWNTRPLEDKLEAKIAELEATIERMEDAWLIDETIAPDGSLRPSISKLLERLDEAEATIEKLIKAGNDLTINPNVGNYEEREAAWTKLWLEWKDGKK